MFLVRLVGVAALAILAGLLPFPFPFPGGSMNPRTLAIVAAAVLAALIVNQYVNVSGLLAKKPAA